MSGDAGASSFRPRFGGQVSKVNYFRSASAGREAIMRSRTFRVIF